MPLAHEEVARVGRNGEGRLFETEILQVHRLVMVTKT
jgi:hypothetical protein